MGGKGGGGGDNGQAAYYAQQQDAANKARIEKETAAAAEVTKAQKAAKAQAAADKKAAADAVKAKADADKAAADQAAADKAAAEQKIRETPLGPAIQAGGAITQPTPNNGGGTPNPLALPSDANTAPGSAVGAGNVLGGAVLSPPSYWAGSHAYGPRTPRQSSLRTTNV